MNTQPPATTSSRDYSSSYANSTYSTCPISRNDLFSRPMQSFSRPRPSYSRSLFNSNRGSRFSGNNSPYLPFLFSQPSSLRSETVNFEEIPRSNSEIPNPVTTSNSNPVLFP